MSTQVRIEQASLQLGRRQQAILAVLCLCSGIVPLAARWIPGDAARISYGLIVAVGFLAVTLAVKRDSSLRQFSDLTFAFFILAFVQLLNNSIPGFVGTNILHSLPSAGNPLASTVAGSVIIQLLEAAIAIVPVVIFTVAMGRDLGSIYARPGKLGGWLAVAIIFFIAFYLFVATLPLRPDSPAHRLLPTNSTLTFDRFLALTPALLVMVISNGFEEELLFRGLFLPKYNAIFGIGLSNVLQAMIFSVAHVGVTYTPSALLFIVAAVFPLGLAAGYLMRATNGIVVPAIFHAGLDVAIYIAFLSYVT